MPKRLLGHINKAFLDRDVNRQASIGFAKHWRFGRLSSVTSREPSASERGLDGLNLRAALCEQLDCNGLLVWPWRGRSARGADPSSAQVTAAGAALGVMMSLSREHLHWGAASPALPDPPTGEPWSGARAADV